MLAWFVVAVGCVAFALAAWKCVYFWRLGTPLSRALSYDVASEFVAVGVTISFSVTTATGGFVVFSPTAEATVRLLIFGSAAVTTWNVSRAIRHTEGPR